MAKQYLNAKMMEKSFAWARYLNQTADDLKKAFSVMKPIYLRRVTKQMSLDEASVNFEVFSTSSKL